jgi:hypothetical protein
MARCATGVGDAVLSTSGLSVLCNDFGCGGPSAYTFIALFRSPSRSTMLSVAAAFRFLLSNHYNPHFFSNIHEGVPYCHLESRSFENRRHLEIDVAIYRKPRREFCSRSAPKLNVITTHNLHFLDNHARGQVMPYVRLHHVKHKGTQHTRRTVGMIRKSYQSIE